MKNHAFLLLLFAFTFLQAQKNNDSINQDEFSLSKQFEEIYKKSSTYKEYKVISSAKYNQLKRNVIDSLNVQKQLVSKKNLIISNNTSEINSLNQKLSEVKNSLNQSLSLKDSRSIFGVSVEKSVFSTIIILTYIILILLTGFFAFKYQQNILTTKKAVKNLQSVELEFEQHKKSSLNRFQEVNRKLQDELNKNWKKEK